MRARGGTLGALGLLAAALWAPGCRPDPLGDGLTGDRLIEQRFVADEDDDVDVLFVVDNSPGMAAEQEALVRGFPRLVSALRTLPEGLPDLRIGVVSSDLGAPGSRVSECESGDRGVLQSPAVEANCPGLSARYLASLDSGTRNNFSGDLADAFACLAPIGTAGCGFEHHLAAARRALDIDQPLENEGFLRRHALLALVIVADEDDCSAPRTTDLFEPATERFGPQGSFRCAEFGHQCGGKPPSRTGDATPLASCRSAESAGRLTPVSEFVRFFQGLKPTSSRVLVSVIAGPSEPYRVLPEGDGAELAPSCTSGGDAAPAVRLKEFATAFGSRGSFASACEGDLGPAMAEIGEMIGRRLRAMCMAASPARVGTDLVDASAGRAPADCNVAERSGPLGPESPLPRCQAGAARPCWRLLDSPELCGAGKLELQVERIRPATAGSELVVRCRACASPQDARCR